jgi:hypothetical protein
MNASDDLDVCDRFRRHQPTGPGERRWQERISGELFRRSSLKVWVSSTAATTVHASTPGTDGSRIACGRFSVFDPETSSIVARRGGAPRSSKRTFLRLAQRSAGYERLCRRLGREPEPVVRSSATAEDLPEASFAEPLKPSSTSAVAKPSFAPSMRAIHRHGSRDQLPRGSA